MIRRTLVCGTFLFSLLITTAALAGQVAGVGKPAPGFKLTAQNGTNHSLGDHQGQVVLLMMIGYL